MEEGFYPIVEWEDEADLETKVKALYNILNWLSREMSIGRVKTNKQELSNQIESTEERLNTPISIAFVKMAEKGDIDETTASENAHLFIEWGENVDYKINDFARYEDKLYKCLQAHKSQSEWKPDVAVSLWKECGIAENGIPLYSQPISAEDAYMTGDEVMYNGEHYRSLIDNNVWAPDVYGWEKISENVGE